MLFTVSISNKTYHTKPLDSEIGKMRFHRINADVHSLSHFIGQGYAYCGVFNNDYRNRDNFIQSSFITYDIDGSSVDMATCLNQLSYEPSIAYTTPSNGLEGMGYRYRLLYLVDEPLASFDEYFNFSHTLSDNLKLNEIVGLDDNGKSCIDGRSFLPEQYWNGCYQCNNIITNPFSLIKKNDIIINESYYNNKYLINNNESAIQTNISIPRHSGVSCTFEIDEKVMNDFMELNRIDFINKYRDTYEYIERSEIEYNEDEPVIKYPDDYYEIWLPWERINGEVKKIKDKEGRRRRLFLNGIIRRKINPNISSENMLYCIAYEFEYYYINNGNKIDKYTILSIVKNIMNAEVRKTNIGKPRYKAFVNPRYCEKYGMTKKQVLGLAKNKKQYIGEFYDFTKTDQENVDIMKEYGLEISIRTLKNWKKENGITKYRKRVKKEDCLILKSKSMKQETDYKTTITAEYADELLKTQNEIIGNNETVSNTYFNEKLCQELEIKMRRVINGMAFNEENRKTYNDEINDIISKVEKLRFISKGDINSFEALKYEILNSLSWVGHLNFEEHLHSFFIRTYYK